MDQSSLPKSQESQHLDPHSSNEIDEEGQVESKHFLPQIVIRKATRIAEEVPEFQRADNDEAETVQPQKASFKNSKTLPNKVSPKETPGLISNQYSDFNKTQVEDTMLMPNLFEKNQKKFDGHLVLQKLKDYDMIHKKGTKLDQPKIDTESDGQAEDDNIQELQFQLDEFNAGDSSQDANKAAFRNNYGVQQSFPFVYVQDAKVFPQNPEQILQVVKYVMPRKDQKAHYFPFEEHPQQLRVSELFGEDQFRADNVVLQLVQNYPESGLQVVKEVPIVRAFEVNISFSKDGKYFSIFRRRLHTLQIYSLSSDDLADLLDLVQQNKYQKELANKPEIIECHSVKFDQENRFIAIWSMKEVHVLSLEEGSEDSLQSFKIDERFERILDLQLLSSSDQDFYCEVACKQAGQKNVIVFDVSLESSEINLDRNIAYLNDIDPVLLQVKISADFSSVAFVHGNENYVLIEDHGEYCQFALSWLKSKQISYVLNQGNQFFFVCHDRYDHEVDIISSSVRDFKISISKRIEPGKFTVLDVTQFDVKSNGFGKKMVIAGVKDSVFQIDECSPLKSLLALGTLQDKPISNLKTRFGVVRTEDHEEEDEYDEELDQEALNSVPYKQIGFLSSNNLTLVRGFCISWPIVAFASFKNKLLLFNAFQSDEVCFIDPPNQEEYIISHIFITNEMDLFLVLKSESLGNYQVWQTNLVPFIASKNKGISFSFCIEYSFATVDHAELLDIFVRSASKEEVVDMNRRLMVFLLHRGGVFQWQKPLTDIQKVCSTQSRSFTMIDEQSFILEVTESVQGVQTLMVKRMDLLFSTFQMKLLFSQPISGLETIKATALDYKSNILVVLHKPRQKGGKKTSSVKIVDLENAKTLLTLDVNDREIIGRIKSGLFTLVDGHFFFGNSVLKLRLDLLHTNQRSKLKQNTIFDKYEDLLDINSSERVLQLNPILCKRNHRMAFFMHDPDRLKPLKMVILPFLHERKLYLNRMGHHHKHFYFCIDQPQKLTNRNRTLMVSMDITFCKFHVFSERGILVNEVNFKEQSRKYGHPIQVSSNGRNFLFQKQDQQGVLHLLTFTQHELLFVKTIDIREAVKAYARQIDDSREEQADEKTMSAEIHDQLEGPLSPEKALYFFDVNDGMDVVVQMASAELHELYKQLNQMFRHEEIALLPEILRLMRLKTLKRTNTYMRALDQLAGDSDMTLEEINKKLKECTNKLSDESLRLVLQFSLEFKTELERILSRKSGTIFYIQKGALNAQTEQLPAEVVHLLGEEKNAFDSQAVFFTKDYSEFVESEEIGSFTINEKFVVFWNDFKVFFTALAQTEGHSKVIIHEIDLLVDPEEKQSFIRRVRACSSPERVAIVIRQSEQSDCIVVYDVEKDLEVDSYDVSPDSKVFFDSKGNSYLIEGEILINVQQNVKLKAYDVRKVNDPKYDEFLHFGYFKGHRFDVDNHNWILFNEHLSLSFSFMTFVVRGKGQQGSFDDADYFFDETQYNFILNRRTVFTCDNFVGENYEKLLFVLQHMEQFNPVLLEQLHYYYTLEADADFEIEDKIDMANAENQKQSNKFSFFSLRRSGEHSRQQIQKKITPLHLAFREGNNRSINIILRYMAKIETNASSTFKDILPKLVEFNDFGLYFEKLPFQTIQMLNKQTLRVGNKFSDDIVSVNRSNRAYVDDAYFRTSMGENKTDESLKNFPVEVEALKIDWIVQDQFGTKLLRALLGSEKQELFENWTIVVIIEFLYKHYRTMILWRRLPVYILQLVVYFITIFLNELYESTKNDPQASESELNKVSSWVTLLALINLGLSFMQAGFVGFMGYQSGETFFRSIWSYFDVTYVVINSLVSMSILIEAFINIKELRIIEAVLSIVIVVKLIYFMQLVDQIAPLVNIILLIFVDIGWFMVIFLIILFSLATSFNLIGRNQAEIMAAADSEEDGPQYVSLLGSLQHVYLLSLGEFGLDDYEKGDGVYSVVLWGFFLLSSFLMLIHMLNMLIAIMGETFAQNNETAHIQRIRNHLRFVLDNLFIDPIQDRQRISYLITAFQKEEWIEQEEQLHEITLEIKDIKRQLKQLTVLHKESLMLQAQQKEVGQD